MVAPSTALDPLALPTIVVFIVSGLISLATAAFLYPRVVPMSIFLPTESSMKYMAIRCRVLFAGVLLHLVDVGSSLWYWSLPLTQWPTTSQFLQYRFTWIASFTIVGPFIVIANIMRCAMLVVRDPRSRRWFVYGTVAVCAALWVVVTVGMVQNVYLQRDLDPAPRGISPHLPLVSSVFFGMYPLVIIFSSMWSLRMARTAPSFLSAATDQLQQTVESASQAASVADGTFPRPKRLSQLHTLVRQGVTWQTASASRTTTTGGGGGGGGISSQPSGGRDRGISYKMSGTFTFLTLSQVVLWSAAIFLSLRPLFPGVHSVSVSSILAALALALESSFEALVKIRRSRLHAGVGDIDRFMETEVDLSNAKYSGQSQRQQQKPGHTVSANSSVAMKSAEDNGDGEEAEEAESTMVAAAPVSVAVYPVSTSSVPPPPPMIP
ncbi:hypothetical protein BC828DRAFT_372553 [Blastocladiella britannica]|nr:hypothetical protein BC828DRAFT_372553 [Blastocladiella britannica]